MGGISIDIIPTTKAVCPFCRRVTPTSAKILKGVQIINSDFLPDILSNNINYTKCAHCGEKFFYECTCGAINSDKKYAIVSMPMETDFICKEKSAFLNIIGYNNFKLRLVREFIYLQEKVHIFEFDLDDRVLEIIKYNYVAIPKGLSTSAKVILTGTEHNALIFTVFDDYDKPLAYHRVNLDAYYKTAKDIENEVIESSILKWHTINLKWAEQYVKEKRK